MLSKVRGRFTSFSGTVVVGDPLEDSSVTVSIDAASFTTGDEQRDGHVRSGDFLDVEAFPTLTFEGSEPRRQGDDWVLPGQLTIRGTTRPVEPDVQLAPAPVEARATAVGRVRRGRPTRRTRPTASRPPRRARGLRPAPGPPPR